MNHLCIDNEIQNHLDERLIDCFYNQNKTNQWLQAADIASWVFETNNPSAYQKNYTFRKLNSLVGLKNTAKRRLSAFESSYDPEVEFSLLYRLKNSTHKIDMSQLDSFNNREAAEEFPF